MKLLITTRADEGVAEKASMSHPLFKEYAKRVGADFMALDHESGCKEGNGRWHYRIFKHKELHEEYDRILLLDTDLLLLPGCPNIFEIVDYDKIGTVLEDKGSRRGDRLHRMMAIQQQYGDIGWRDKYINNGVFLSSKCHEGIYETFDGNYWLGPGQDDVHMGYNIHKLGYEYHDLGYKFNHMTMFSERWNNSADRFASHIIHYAGVGVFDKGPVNDLDQMRRDYAKIYG